MNTKKCTKCWKVKQDTEFPIHIVWGVHLWLYKYCVDCSPKRILKRMDRFFSKFKTKL